MRSAILLAAGNSTRMGDQDKLTLIYKGKSLINHMIITLLQSNIDELIIVRKAHDTDFQEGIKEVVLSHIENPVTIKFAENINANLGMTSSIQEGIKLTNSTAEAFMVCQCDMPLITSVDYNKIIEAHHSAILGTSLKTITLPYHNGKKGNPAVFSMHYKSEILKYSESEGLRSIIKSEFEAVKSESNETRARIIKVEMPNSNTLIDIDTPKDWASFKQ